VKRLLASAGVCLTILMAAPAAAQFPLLQQPGQPGAFLDPQELEPTRRAPLTIVPSFTLSEEYNDNVFLDNSNRQSDFITGFTPGIAITYERPTYRLAAGYNFTAELFARETNESHAFDRQNFFLDTAWKVDPFLTLSLTDTFIFSTDTNLIAREQVSTGRDRSLSNTLGAGASYQLTEFWSLRGGASYTLERFSRSGLQDSDVYHANVGVDRRLSSRLTVGAGYDFGYFDIDNEEKTTTHTPRIGASWRATDTITLALSGGPTVERRESGQTRVTPAITASYAQRVFFGSVGLAYDRAVGTASGLGGPTDNDLISGYVTGTTLLRGLTVQFLPRYSNVQSPNSDRIDIRAFTAALAVTYRLTDWVAVIGGYQFFHQRSDSTAVSSIGLPLANDADQNRLFVGLTFGYPIRID
jgi:opacity protein-like surface antigen